MAWKIRWAQMWKPHIDHPAREDPENQDRRYNRPAWSDDRQLKPPSEVAKMARMHGSDDDRGTACQRWISNIGDQMPCGATKIKL